MMQFDISVDTEALVVDAYPQMRSAEHEGVHIDDMDIAWGFYCAMHERHPEMVAAYRDRMKEMMQAVRDIEKATKFTGNGYWTQEEMEEDSAIQRDAAMRGWKGLIK
jgi:hypothetical protein